MATIVKIWTHTTSTHRGCHGWSLVIKGHFGHCDLEECQNKKKHLVSPFRVVNIPFLLVACPSEWFGVEVCRHQRLTWNDVGKCRHHPTSGTVLNGCRHPLPKKNAYQWVPQDQRKIYYTNTIKTRTIQSQLQSLPSWPNIHPMARHGVIQHGARLVQGFPWADDIAGIITCTDPP